MKKIRIEEILARTHEDMDHDTDMEKDDGLHRKGGNYRNTGLHGKAIVVIIVILIIGLLKLVSYRANISKLFGMVHELQRRCDCGNVDS